MAESALIAAVLKAAKRAKAPALEAYPLDADKTPSASGTGFASTFERAGFRTVARRVPPRPIMCHDLTDVKTKKAEQGAAPNNLHAGRSARHASCGAGTGCGRAWMFGCAGTNRQDVEG
jgi:hypothetical protein